VSGVVLADGVCVAHAGPSLHVQLRGFPSAVPWQSGWGRSWSCRCSASASASREDLLLRCRMQPLQSLKSRRKKLKPKLVLWSTLSKVTYIGLPSLPHSPCLCVGTLVIFLSLNFTLVKQGDGVFLFTKLFLVLIVLAGSLLEECLSV